MTCPNCSAPLTTNTVYCEQCGAKLPEKTKRRFSLSEMLPQRADSVAFLFTVFFSVAATVVVWQAFGWPWAILGTWMGFLLACALCRFPLWSNFLTAILSLATTCVIGPIEAFLLLPTPWRWLGTLWLLGSLVLTVRTLTEMRPLLK
jgi:hypothetical protein